MPSSKPGVDSPQTYERLTSLEVTQRDLLRRMGIVENLLTTDAQLTITSKENLVRLEEKMNQLADVELGNAKKFEDINHRMDEQWRTINKILEAQASQKYLWPVITLLSTALVAVGVFFLRP